MDKSLMVQLVIHSQQIMGKLSSINPKRIKQADIRSATNF